MLLFPFFSFLFYFLRSMVSNGEILQHKASIGHSSNSGRAEDSDLEVCFNFPDSWLPITINMIIPLLQLMDIGHVPKLWIPGCQIFAINFFHFEYLCSSYLSKKYIYICAPHHKVEQCFKRLLSIKVRPCKLALRL